MKHEFDTVLKKLEGKIAWTVFYVPFSVDQEYGTNGRLNVKAVIDGHPFAGTLLPSRNGHYMVYNQAIRTACGKSLGEALHVVMEPDAEIRRVEVPRDIQEALLEDGDAARIFAGLADYLKKEMIARIESARKPETRSKRISELLKHLHTRASKV